MRWARFQSNDGGFGFGVIEGENVAEYAGELFGAPRPTGRVIGPGEFTLRSPCTPSLRPVPTLTLR